MTLKNLLATRSLPVKRIDLLKTETSTSTWSFSFGVKSNRNCGFLNISTVRANRNRETEAHCNYELFAYIFASFRFCSCCGLYLDSHFQPLAKFREIHDSSRRWELSLPPLPPWQLEEACCRRSTGQNSAGRPCTSSKTHRPLSSSLVPRVSVGHIPSIPASWRKEEWKGTFLTGELF